MKRFRKTHLLKNGFVFLLLFGLLGIVACKKTPPESYVQSATFIVLGTIESDSLGNIIPGICITYKLYDTTNKNWDSAYSDSTGHYQVSKTEFRTSAKIRLHFADVDSIVKFQSKDTVVEFNNPQFSNGYGEWFIGEASKEINFRLKPVNK